MEKVLECYCLSIEDISNRLVVLLEEEDNSDDLIGEIEN